MKDRIKIEPYRPEHQASILETLLKEPAWDILTNKNTIGSYKDLLGLGPTYVCHDNGRFCGYVRGVLDKGLAVYISELYVKPEWRNNGIGQLLIEKMKSGFPGLVVYALSDEDAYYIKKGYKHIGSVFQI